MFVFSQLHFAVASSSHIASLSLPPPPPHTHPGFSDGEIYKERTHPVLGQDQGHLDSKMKVEVFCNVAQAAQSSVTSSISRRKITFFRSEVVFSRVVDSVVSFGEGCM